eukprot:CAMPEP_0167787928 /NCGR_PEP_ID=MMETSP0111_2-20121227/9720_1 /TAXON_ID=91324 /ORGANISM="Lotharella globosa, Strain CCCM811" /LENGTH=260 /DNA_ID=CAMNT_0007679675 /DNA_START=33 /DNA_END=812 /DNA_ORIENTATION=+
MAYGAVERQDYKVARKHGLFLWRKWNSFLPYIFAAEIAFFCALAALRRSEGQLSLGQVTGVYALCATMTVWAIIATLMANKGWFSSDAVLKSFPGFWIPALPLTIVGLGMCFEDVRSGLVRIVQWTHPAYFVGLQCVRILAIESLVKWYQGLFPPILAKFVAIPDTIFGFSAWVMLMLELSEDVTVSRQTYVIWNVLGILAVVPVGCFAISADMPGPLQILWRQFPPNLVVLQLPLALGPLIVIPILLGTNLLVAAVYYW